MAISCGVVYVYVHKYGTPYDQFALHTKIREYLSIVACTSKNCVPMALSLPVLSSPTLASMYPITISTSCRVWSVFILLVVRIFRHLLLLPLLPLVHNMQLLSILQTLS